MHVLKAMVSGAIGGFLDVAFNFHTLALLDDNLIGKLFVLCLRYCASGFFLDAFVIQKELFILCHRPVF